MKTDIWTKSYLVSKLKDPVAVVGSPGLRSIGKLAVDKLVAQTKAQLTAEVYSTHLPSFYQTTPSYAAHPSLPGFGGAFVETGSIDLPKVQLYSCENPALLLVRGYHPNFKGQYSVAQQVLRTIIEMGVKQMVVIAGFGTKEKKICCAAHTQKTLDEMKEKFGICVGYKGPFMGFSGLVFGLAKRAEIEALCLFVGTEPVEENLEFPDEEGAVRAVDLLNRMLSLPKS
jgi:proteasome assembly chaperone (PAC2) family protein